MSLSIGVVLEIIYVLGWDSLVGGPASPGKLRYGLGG